MMLRLSDGRQHDVHLIDDGTLDTVIQLDGTNHTFASEAVASLRDRRGRLVEDALTELAELSLDSVARGFGGAGITTKLITEGIYETEYGNSAYVPKGPYSVGCKAYDLDLGDWVPIELVTFTRLRDADETDRMLANLPDRM